MNILIKITTIVVVSGALVTIGTVALNKYERAVFKQGVESTVKTINKQTEVLKDDESKKVQGINDDVDSLSDDDVIKQLRESNGLYSDGTQLYPSLDDGSQSEDLQRPRSTPTNIETQPTYSVADEPTSEGVEAQEQPEESAFKADKERSEEATEERLDEKRGCSLVLQEGTVEWVWVCPDE